MAFRDVDQKFFKWWRAFYPATLFKDFRGWRGRGSLVEWEINAWAINDTERAEWVVATVDILNRSLVVTRAPVVIAIDFGDGVQRYTQDLLTNPDDAGILAIIPIMVPGDATLGFTDVTVTAQQHVEIGDFNVLAARTNVASGAYTVDSTLNTITDGAEAITAATTVQIFLSNLVKNTTAAWKVVEAATPVTTPAEFDAAAARLGTDTLVVGDLLAIKAVDGGIRLYAITVTP